MITLAGAGAIIEDSNNYIFMVRVRRRGMVRWELPTGIRRNGESLFLTLYRCIDEESSSQLIVRIGRQVCLSLNKSLQFNRQFFAMFFECQVKSNNIKHQKTEYTNLPEDLRQNIIESKFKEWQQINEDDIHPQHFEILTKWSQLKNGPLFLVSSDADVEYQSYRKSKGLPLENPSIDEREKEPDESQNNQMDSSKHFHNATFGDNATILIGDNNRQVVNNTNIKGNFEILSDTLRKNSVSDEDISSLKNAIGKDESSIKSKNAFGSSVKEWFKEMLSKAVDTSWNIELGVASSLLATALNNYYGWFQ